MSELLLFWSLSWMGYKKVSREIVSPEWSDQAQARLLVLTTVSWAERAVPDTRNPWEPVPDAGPGCDQAADIHISLISLNSITHFLISLHRPRTSRSDPRVKCTQFVYYLYLLVFILFPKVEWFLKCQCTLGMGKLEKTKKTLIAMLYICLLSINLYLDLN